MKRYSQKEITDLKRARRSGQSIPQLMDQFNMPKTTIWHHVNDIKLAPSLLKKIRSRQGGSVDRNKKDWETAEIAAASVLDSTHCRELAIAGSMLYWAEGTKGALVFTNTNLEMLKLFMNFMEKCLNISKSDYRLLIRIATPINPDNALMYWSKQLGIDMENTKLDWNDKNNKTKTEFGVCRIWVVKSGYHFKVLQCMISSLKKLS